MKAFLDALFTVALLGHLLFGAFKQFHIVVVGLYIIFVE
jgi:hypothetical protein